jgi:wyosine [tRNA(Phe)-imidazoG37] synthetase (radical SAM superfamily)
MLFCCFLSQLWVFASDCDIVRRIMKKNRKHNNSKHHIPELVVANSAGEIYEIPQLAATVDCAGKPSLCPDDLWIPLPEGSDLFLLPNRSPIGANPATGEMMPVPFDDSGPLMAVAAFISPAFTVLRRPVCRKEEEAPLLPLYAYCAVGWMKNRFWVPAVRVDRDIRQELGGFDLDAIQQGAVALKKRYPNNRLAAHLMDNCVTRYSCPAARNFALGRWEMPLPTATACNSRCVGCISLQPDEDAYTASQDRIAFTPTVEEIAELAIPHLREAERPIASFGQGCEGEPLVNPKLLRGAIEAIRKETDKGTINLNTNGSRPDVVAELFDAGLDAIRVSINSAIEERYNAYTNPVNYVFEDVVQSIAVARKKGKWASINYLVFPGVSDTPSELEALLALIERTELHMIQWRNLNIDPDDYQPRMKVDEEPIGLENVMKEVKKRFPDVRFGYFNPYLK